MNKKISLILVFLMVFIFVNSVFAQRDWEYWSCENFAIPIDKTISYLINTEWRFNNDMDYNYLFKVETGPSFKINNYLEIAPYYVYQEKQSKNMWDRSDLVYLDASLKSALVESLDIKFSNRFRYQYDFDKAKTILRDAIKISKGFKIGRQEIAPYFSEEPFYDAKLARITEHRTTAGMTYAFTKNISLGIGYMLNSKKGTSKWTYANVLMSNLNIRF